MTQKIDSYSEAYYWKNHTIKCRTGIFMKMYMSDKVSHFFPGDLKVYRSECVT